jgi:hypothetical protein
VGTGTGFLAFLLCKRSGGSDGECAGIGAGVAVAGGVATYLAMRHIADRDDTIREREYSEDQGVQGYIDQVSVVPDQISAGQAIELRSRWAIVAPNPTQAVAYREEWLIRKDGGANSKQLAQQGDAVEQGTYESGIDFKVPGDWPPGVYVVTYALTLEDRTLSEESHFELSRRRINS